MKTSAEERTGSRSLLWLIPVLLLPTLIWWFVYRGEVPKTVEQPTAAPPSTQSAPLPLDPPLAGGGEGAFGAWDRDGDDRLGRAEFERAWTSVGWQDAGAAFPVFDENRDGGVDEKEFFGRLCR